MMNHIKWTGSNFPFIAECIDAESVCLDGGELRIWDSTRHRDVILPTGSTIWVTSGGIPQDWRTP